MMVQIKVDLPGLSSHEKGCLWYLLYNWLCMCITYTTNYKKHLPIWVLVYIYINLEQEPLNQSQ